MIEWADNFGRERYPSVEFPEDIMSHSRKRATPAGGLVACALLVVLISSAGSALVERPADAATQPKPTVVERRVVTIPGIQGSTPGPRSIVLRFPRPTSRGDLLVAGVDDGVETSGMAHARYLFPGWRRAVTTIGGQTAGTGTGPHVTGGLQAAIYFYPNNPGGISAVRIATIPRNSLDWVSVVLVEFAGVSTHLSVDTTGESTNGPTPHDYTQVSTVRTSSVTSHDDDLVLAVFNNGDNSPHGVRYVNSPGWTVAGEIHDPDSNQQPILLDYRIERNRSVVSETDRYVGGYPIDNCAVVAALK